MKPYTAEAIGTFALVFFGVGSAVLAGGEIGFVGISFAFGVSAVARAYSIGPALFVDGDALGQLWLFAVAPLIGGAIGGVLLKMGITSRSA